jgi:hypothetical protein
MDRFPLLPSTATDWAGLAQTPTPDAPSSPSRPAGLHLNAPHNTPAAEATKVPPQTSRDSFKRPLYKRPLKPHPPPVVVREQPGVVDKHDKRGRPRGGLSRVVNAPLAPAAAQGRGRLPCHGLAHHLGGRPERRGMGRPAFRVAGRGGGKRGGFLEARRPGGGTQKRPPSPLSAARPPKLGTPSPRATANATATATATAPRTRLSVAVGTRRRCCSPTASTAATTSSTRRPRLAVVQTTGAHEMARSCARASSAAFDWAGFGGLGGLGGVWRPSPAVVCGWFEGEEAAGRARCITAPGARARGAQAARAVLGRLERGSRRRAQDTNPSACSAGPTCEIFSESTLSHLLSTITAARPSRAISSLRRKSWGWVGWGCQGPRRGGFGMVGKVPSNGVALCRPLGAGREVHGVCEARSITAAREKRQAAPGRPASTEPTN